MDEYKITFTKQGCKITADGRPCPKADYGLDDFYEWQPEEEDPFSPEQAH